MDVVMAGTAYHERLVALLRHDRHPVGSRLLSRHYEVDELANVMNLDVLSLPASFTPAVEQPTNQLSTTDGG
jgi:hypothetical protein